MTIRSHTARALRMTARAPIRLTQKALKEGRVTPSVFCVSLQLPKDQLEERISYSMSETSPITRMQANHVTVIGNACVKRFGSYYDPRNHRRSIDAGRWASLSRRAGCLTSL